MKTIEIDYSTYDVEGDEVSKEILDLIKEKYPYGLYGDFKLREVESILCLDKHDDENVIALHNYKPFKEEIKEIYSLQDNKETDNQVILDLIKETDHKHIESDCIRDKNGNKVPDPFTKDEVRDKKIDIINNI